MSIGGTALKIAQKLIPKFGKQITFIRVTEGAYNPATGKTVNTEASEVVFGLEEAVSGKNFSKELVEAEDRQVTVSADVAKLSLLDKIKIGGVTFSVVNVKIEVAGELDVLYIYHCRKA